MALPERVPTPVARAIVEQRRALDARSEPAHGAVAASLWTCDRVIPSQYYDDTSSILALSTARARSSSSEAAASAPSVQQLLWDTALRIEDGKLSMAEKDLRAIQQKLQDALANNAPDAEIEKLIQELQQAIDKYLDAMVEQARRNPGELQQQPMDRNAMRIERRDLQKMLDQARQMARPAPRTPRARCSRGCRRCSRTCAWASRCRASSKATARRSR